MSQFNYPYQKSFELFLKQSNRANITIDEYSATLVDLFKYLSNFNVGYQRDHRVSQLFDRDIQQYMQMLINNRKINDSTYNKVLSHINIYFKYLFNHQFTTKLPTLNLKSKSSNNIKNISLKWLNNINTIILDQNIHPYTRLTLLLISKGYNSKEFLQPNFYKQLKFTKFNETDKKFLQQFKNFISPIQIKQNSKDIFLKQRFSNNPHITMPGLHKYLNPDSKLLNMNLSPTNLFQSYVVNYMINHKKMSVFQLSNTLNLSLSSILYYKKLIYELGI